MQKYLLTSKQFNMKKQILLLIALLLTATLFAQNTPNHFKADKQFFEPLQFQGIDKMDIEQILKERNSNIKKQEFKHFKSEDDLIWVMDSTFYSIWDMNLDDWVTLQKIEFNYDANGFLIEEFSYDWQPEMTQWTKNTKRIYSNNEIGLVTELFSYGWNDDIEEWVVYSKIIKSYDDNENLIESLGYSWNVVIEDWSESSKTFRSYDSNGNVIQDQYFKLLQMWILASYCRREQGQK